MTRHLPEIAKSAYAPDSEELEYQPDRGPEMLAYVIVTVVFVAGAALGFVIGRAW